VLDWIDADGKTFGELKDSEVIKPGVLIEMAEGGTFLIGDVNPMGGVCDDCQQEVTYRAVVVRYATVWPVG
jgi:hypothetical protein